MLERHQIQPKPSSETRPRPKAGRRSRPGSAVRARPRVVAIALQPTVAWAGFGSTGRQQDGFAAENAPRASAERGVFTPPPPCSVCTRARQRAPHKPSGQRPQDVRRAGRCSASRRAPVERALGRSSDRQREKGRCGTRPTQAGRGRPSKALAKVYTSQLGSRRLEVACERQDFGCAVGCAQGRRCALQPMEYPGTLGQSGVRASSRVPARGTCASPGRLQKKRPKPTRAPGTGSGGHAKTCCGNDPGVRHDLAGKAQGHKRLFTRSEGPHTRSELRPQSPQRRRVWRPQGAPGSSQVV